MKKSAFTLIELIIAIVIISIAMLAIPTMIQTTSNSSINNLEVQEAIFKAIVITKKISGENNFNDVDLAVQTTPIDTSAEIGLVNYKFKHKYTLTIDSNATFNGETNTTIKKLITNIYKQDGTSHLAQIISYKFDY